MCGWAERGNQEPTTDYLTIIFDDLRIFPPSSLLVLHFSLIKNRNYLFGTQLSISFQHFKIFFNSSLNNYPIYFNLFYLKLQKKYFAKMISAGKSIIFLVSIIFLIGIPSIYAIQCWNGVGDKAVKITCPGSLAQGMQCGIARCKNSIAGQEVITRACAPSNFCELQRKACETIGQGKLDDCDTCYGDLCNGAIGKFTAMAGILIIAVIFSIFGLQTVMI